MKLINKKHVFFDLDHTLWDFDVNSRLAFENVFKKHKIALTIDDFLEVYVPVNENYWKLYQENKVSSEKLRYGRLKESFDLLQIMLHEDQIFNMSDDYLQFLPTHNRLLEGPVDLLEYLKSKYKLHIITNGFKKVQHEKLTNSKISSYFETITTSEDAGVKKPHRLIFEKAMAEAGALPEESVMIGDNFEADILGAEKIGMQAILYNYYKREFSKDYLQVLEMKQIAAYL